MNQLPTLHSTYYSIVIGYVLFGLVPILRTRLWGYDIHYRWIEDITFKIVIVKVLLLRYHVIWLSINEIIEESSIIPRVGITISERIRDRGGESVIAFDDLSKHAKSYRQISPIPGTIPSRDAYPSDISNIHSSISERVGKIRMNYLGGSITAFPIIETNNRDITESIATNVISTTDGQSHCNKRLFLDQIRPCIDSAPSVSRIGSNAQRKLQNGAKRNGNGSVIMVTSLRSRYW